MVKNPPSNAGDSGSIPGWGTRVPHAAGQLSPLTTTRHYRSLLPAMKTQHSHKQKQNKPKKETNTHCKSTAVVDALVVKSCPTLCNPTDCSPPGSSIHGISQVRILEWIAISFSRGLLDQGIETMSPTFQADSLIFEPPGKPVIEGMWAFLQIKDPFKRITLPATGLRIDYNRER